MKDAVEQVLDLTQRLALPTDQPVRFIGLDVQQKHVLVILLGDRGFETQGLEHLAEGVFGTHGDLEDIFRRPGWTGTTTAAPVPVPGPSFDLVILVCRMVIKFWVVQYSVRPAE